MEALMADISTLAATHMREHRSVLAAPEKRLLVWIAERLPPWVGSDHLSGIGLGAMVAAGAAFAAFPATRHAGWLVVACLVANWLGDSLDGTVARVRGQQRPRYGFYVDHVIDVAGTTFLLGGLACSGVMNATLALALLAAYLLVASESYLATHAAGIFRMSFAGFGPTELRILLAIGVIKVMNDPWLTLGQAAPPVRLFDLGAVVAVVGLTIAFVASAIRTTRALYLAEPLDRSVRPSRAA
jgi:phosphatidylglycerophosphate synthase